MKTLLFFAAIFFHCIFLQAQVSTDPSYITADIPVTLYFDATGSDLEGYNGDMYVHTGITVNSNPWQYVIGNWGDNSIQPQLTRIDANLYQLDILPSIREYYYAAMEDSISEICLVFRSENGMLQTYPDIFVPVYETIFEFVNFSTADTVICENDTVIFTVNNSGLIADSLLWDFPGGIPSGSTEFEPEVYYETAGLYDVELIAFFQGNPIVVSKEDYINVGELPVIPPQPQGETLICFDHHSSTYSTNNQNIIWQLIPENAGNYSYSDSTCLVFWNEAFSGTAQLQVQSFNDCGTSDLSEALVIEKTEKPNTDFTATPLFIPEAPYEVQFINLTPNPELYDFTWHFGNGDSSQVVEPLYTYTGSGMYSVSLVATHIENDCSDTLTKADFIHCSATGINDFSQDGFRYFVNYTEKTLELIFDETPKGYRFIMYSMSGLIQKSMVLNHPITKVPLHNLPTGVCLFRITNEDRAMIGKIFIMK
ncbi:MAG: hypothetical protein K9H16_16350, partial [Bacteroidales bacterium]|nr:hypothetical protein [Bacteroidales bacterium]